MQLYFSGEINSAGYQYQSSSYGAQPSEFPTPAMYDLVGIGTQFQGSFSYDPATEPYWMTSYTSTYCCVPSSGTVTTSASYYGGEFSLQVGDTGLWAPTTSIWVTNDQVSFGSGPGLHGQIIRDSFGADASSFNGLETSGSAYPALSVGFFLSEKFSPSEDWWTGLGDEFDSASLPEMPPSLEDFGGWLSVNFGRNEYGPGGYFSESYWASGNLTYLGTTPHATVPEPGSFGLIGLGLALLMLMCRAAKRT